MKLKLIKRSGGLALAIPKSFTNAGLIPANVGDFLEIEIKAK